MIILDRWISTRQALLFAGLITGLLCLLPSALAAPAPRDEPDLSILELEATPEEKMIYGELPTPDVGTENPEDLLTSSPLAQPAKDGKKTAKSAPRKNAMPAKTRDARSAPKPEELPPLPEEDAVAPEASAQAPRTVKVPQASLGAGTDSLSDYPEVVTPAAPGDDPEAEKVADAGSDVEVTSDDEVPSENDTVAASESMAEPGSEAESGLAPEGEETRGTSTKRWARSVPMYERENPTWGFDLHGSLNALGDTIKTQVGTTGDIVEYATRNFGIGVEFQPRFLQSIGVVSIGPSVNMYHLSRVSDAQDPNGNVTDGPLSILSFGGSIKYQLNWFRGQPVVPFVGYEVQMIKYSFAEYSDAGSGWTTSTGPTLGALLLLNWLEPSAAHSLWSDSGIKRSYLMAEWKMLTAGEPLLSAEGSALYFGIRLEL